ncbi:aspartyl-tRNA synthetase [Ferrithrix thermotolerans DSM 19514]|jgi:nondiscriminating aspartyl-tRNA synthetase|uniref:Aspartate--tRNA ligase n=1 Tax=Ferrithrix thermotolerans DSM 19514 TaxID=1121881 RepID=A0A1M4XPP2_9ACTN|nr:aspartate--tRNA(Asn) ligase [Ferrithrix thermotolerans]SHE95435.1 aspartyl-tRNA synthetase [Ferrithrix thermotolerans DSM 19514]
MIERTTIASLDKFEDQKVTVCGWVEKIRDQKTVQFIVLRDETGSAQLVREKVDRDPVCELISALPAESVVSVEGVVKLDPRVKLGGLELKVEAIDVLSKAETLPINEETSLDKRLDWRFIDLRSRRNRLIFEVQTELERSYRKTWESEGFIEIHSPKLMAAASESGAELFRVDYFDTSAYLAQSPQFYKQMAMAAGFNKVFEIGPVFRANPSFTSRHDTEFTSVDVEISWIDSHEDVMNFEQHLLTEMLGHISETFQDEIFSTFGVDVVVPKLPFPRIKLSDAIDLVERSGHKVERTDGDLDPEGERRIAEFVQREFGHQFVFLTDYPATVRPYYHMRHPENHTLTKSFDLVWKGLEITTGAQREHRYDILVAQAEEKGLELAPLQFYLDFFRFGMPPHGGFGMGLTRVLMILLGLKNVREVTFLYRGPNRLSP